MATGYAAETIGVLDGLVNPAGKLDGRVVGSRVRTNRSVLDLALATTKGANGDNNLLGRFPRGARPIGFNVNSTVDLGAAATIAIGTLADAVKYKAAAVHRTPDAPVIYMKAGVQDDAPLADYEDYYLTVGAANLPGAGIIVVDAFYSSR